MTKSKHHVYPRKWRKTDNPNRGEIKSNTVLMASCLHIIICRSALNKLLERLKNFLPSDVELKIVRCNHE